VCVVLCGESGKLGRLGFDRLGLDNGAPGTQPRDGTRRGWIHAVSREGINGRYHVAQLGQMGFDTYRPGKVSGLPAWQ